MGLGWQLALVLLLVGLNALFAGSEIALISLREGQLRRLEGRGARGRALGRLARDPNRFLATIQIGITLAGFLASATAAVTLAEPLVAPLSSVVGGAARPLSIVIVTAALTFVTLVLGELAPKRVAMQRSERWALTAARPLSGLASMARPFVWLLGRSTDLTVRLLGVDPTLGREDITREEIHDLVATGGLWKPEERLVITGALEATDRTLRQVLRPRRLVLMLRDDLSTDEAVARLVEAGHSRAPVFHEELDDADRVVTILDLVGRTGLVADHARPAVALPESVALIDALRTLQAERQSLALVVSEYGGVEGIVTVEDLVEEFVGEIHDEYDRDVREAVRSPDGSVTVVGHFPIHDLVDLDVDMPSGDYVTVAGFVHDRLGRLPVAGDRFRDGNWDVTVLSVRGRTIEQVRLAPVPHGDTTDDGATGTGA